MYYAKINPVVSLVPLKKQSKKCLKLKLPEGYEPPSALNNGTTATPLLTVFRYKKIKHGYRIKANYTKPHNSNNEIILTLTKHYCLYGKFSLGDWLVYRRCKIADLVHFWNDVFGVLSQVGNTSALTITPNDLLPSSILDYKKNEIHNALSEDVTFDFNETLFLFIALTFRYANCHECFGDKSCSSASSSCSSSSSSFCSSSSSSDCSSSSSSSSSC